MNVSKWKCASYQSGTTKNFIYTVGTIKIQFKMMFSLESFSRKHFDEQLQTEVVNVFNWTCLKGTTDLNSFKLYHSHIFFLIADFHKIL